MIGGVVICLVMSGCQGDPATSSTDVSLNSGCSDYLAIEDQSLRHAAAARLSREAQADNAGNPMWGLSVDAACGARPDQQVREAFNLAPAQSTSVPAQSTETTPSQEDPTLAGPDPITLERLTQTVTGIDTCQLFTARDFYDLTGELPERVSGRPTGDGDECMYITAAKTGFPALQLQLFCPNDVQNIWDSIYAEPAPAVAPQGAKAQDTGNTGVRTNGGACILSVYPGWDELAPEEHFAALKIALERQERAPRNFPRSTG